jgi:hypothetical protein
VLQGVNGLALGGVNPGFDIGFERLEFQFPSHQKGFQFAFIGFAVFDHGNSLVHAGKWTLLLALRISCAQGCQRESKFRSVAAKMAKTHRSQGFPRYRTQWLLAATPAESLFDSNEGYVYFVLILSAPGPAGRSGANPVSHEPA